MVESCPGKHGENHAGMGHNGENGRCNGRHPVDHVGMDAHIDVIFAKGLKHDSQSPDEAPVIPPKTAEAVDKLMVSIRLYFVGALPSEEGIHFFSRRLDGLGRA